MRLSTASKCLSSLFLALLALAAALGAVFALGWPLEAFELFASSAGGMAALSEGGLGTMRFMGGILAALFAAWSAAMALMAKFWLPSGEPMARNAMLASLIAWFVIDESFSVVLAPWNAIGNLPIFGLALFWLLTIGRGEKRVKA